MKVAHLISSNGLFGAEKVMLSLATVMNREGVASWILALNNMHNPHFEVIEEAQKANILCRSIESKGRFDFSAVSQIAALLKENDIDVLHTHNYKSNLLGLLAAKKVGIPIVATLHGYLGESRRVRFYEAVDRSILRFFSRVVLVDKGLEKWFKGGKVKTEVINNGVAIPNIEPEARKATGLIIGTVGRLSVEKGYKYLIEAFEKVVEKYPEARLLIVGDGPDRKVLELRVASAKLKDRVVFTGFQKDVVSYYKKMDIYVSSSLLEHFPLVILEAMSFGKAVVATDVGSVKMMVKDGETGLLVKPGSAQQLVETIGRLIDDSGLKQRLGGAACRFVQENYSLDKMLAAYKHVYEGVVTS